MQTPPALKQRKTTWLMIVLALAVVPLLLVFATSRQLVTIRQTTVPSPNATPLYAVAVAMLLLALVWTLTRVKPKQEVGGQAELLAPGQFQTNTITALAFAESAAIFGFVLSTSSHRLQDVLVLGGASIAVMLGVVLPSGLKYWSLLEQQGE